MKILESVVGGLLAAMTALVMYQVVGRYILGNPPSWTEELARYLQIWLVLLAAPICLSRGMHLSVDYLTPKLPERPRFLMRAAVLCLIALFSLILTIYGVRLLSVAALQVSPALGISMVWPYLAVPVSGAAMCLVSIALFAQIRRGNMPVGSAGK